MVLCLINSIVFGGLSLIFLDDILLFFGATAETISYAREFMSIILFGTPITYVFIGLNNLMRATGYPKKAMISALISVGINIIFAPIFIFKFKWGIAGAALATLCGQLVAFVWVLIHFFSKSSFIHFQRNNRWFTPSIIKRIYAIGLSPFLMNVCACVVVVFINKALLDTAGVNGNMAVGAYGIINRTTMFFVMVVFGITQGMQPILGFNFGANQWDRVKYTLKLGMICGFTIHNHRLHINRMFSQCHKPFIYDRHNFNRNSKSRVQNIFCILSGGRYSDCYSEFLSVNRKA